MNNRKLEHVQLHSAIFIPGCGNYNTTLATQGDRKTIGLEMWKVDDGIILKVQTKDQGKKLEKEAFIPNGNIMSMTFLKDEKNS